MFYTVPTKHRSLALLGGTLVIQVLLLAVQIPRNQGGQTVRLIRVWAVWLVSPFQRVGAWAVDSVSGAWGSYVDLRDIRAENQRLQSELDTVKLRNQELEGLAAENKRLAALLEFKSARGAAQMVAARVIGSDASVGTSRVIYVINRGRRDGLQPDMPVITPDGVVGKTLEVFGDTAQVQLLSDKESGVGALLSDSRTVGVVRGQGEPWLLMDFVVNSEPVTAGERILTSGLDRIFPKDLPVGTVIDTTPGTPHQKIRVQPAARLDRLEEVLVLLTRQDLTPATEAAKVKAEAPPAP